LTSDRTNKILCLVGTRPEVVKMAPVIRALRRVSWAEVIVCATGQHRDLADGAFAAFGITPHLNLGVMTENQTLARLTSRLIEALDSTIRQIGPDLVIAQGDTTTVMAAALTCFYVGTPFAHLEAGLRTGNLMNPFPEELNRTVCSRIAALHFTPTRTASRALFSEGVDPHSVILTGNTVIDALLQTADGAIEPQSRKLVLVTAHRRENFGVPLTRILTALRDTVKNHPDIEVLYPVHPNPNVSELAKQILGDIERVTLCEPLGYHDFVNAMRRAYVIVSDSGGVQEEAPALGKPVLVIREETERPEAIAAGVARLVGTSYESVRSSLEELLIGGAVYRMMSRGFSPYGDGKASNRVVDALEVFFGIKAARNVADFDASILTPA
jgi:UDP-N-acetylglucosamine 2-epimerase (non-hydrolysing)